jgi:hypothetical protein
MSDLPSFSPLGLSYSFSDITEYARLKRGRNTARQVVVAKYPLARLVGGSHVIVSGLVIGYGANNLDAWDDACARVTFPKFFPTN